MGVMMMEEEEDKLAIYLLHREADSQGLFPRLSICPTRAYQTSGGSRSSSPHSSPNTEGCLKGRAFGVANSGFHRLSISAAWGPTSWP